MQNLLKIHFGYDTFRPLQKEIIDTILSGQDALVLMPTGGGKSLCYQLPALTLPGITLVISPLIALMKDQVDALCANGISAAFINSSLTFEEQTNVMHRARSGDLSILYLAPERLSAFGFSDFLDSINVSLLAIDEAHCISEWGHDFRPDYRNLRSLRNKIPNAPVMALTATATPRVRDDILDQLGMEKAATFVSSFNRENLHYSVRPKTRTFSQLVELLQSHKGESVIIYCFSRKNTEDISEGLEQSGFKVLPYHAGLEKHVRKDTQEKFIRDEVPIIVATIAFGMGIDKPDVRLVVHMDLPKTIEGYYQETGRAGRDGLPSECVLFYSFGDRRKQEYFINQIEDPNEQILALQKLDDVVRYCESDLCRRAELLKYFGEDYAENSCHACDNCTAPQAEMIDATEISQKILSAVIRTGERFGAGYVCDVLRGSKKKQVVDWKHDRLSVHGIAKDKSNDALREHFRALQKLGYLEQNDGEFPTLRVSSKGKQALANGDSILLPKLNIVATAPAKKSGVDLDYNVEIFEKLRALRKRIADEQNVPPFVIFGDKTLIEMAYYLPSTVEAFAQLFGVGKQKLEAFGQEFVACIVENAGMLGLEEKPVPKKAVRRLSSATGRKSTTLDETKALLEQKLSIKEIAQERGLSPGTIIQHIEKLAHANDAPDIDHLRPSEDQFQEIKQAFIKSGSSSLTPAYKILREKYSYDELRLVRLFL